MRIDAVELIRVRLPFIAAFRSALGSDIDRDALLVHVLTDDADGWGECAAMSLPLYTPEYVEGAQAVMRDHLVPRLLASDAVDGTAVERILSPIKGHRMARAALEMAVLDADLRVRGDSLAQFLGAERDAVECGAVLGIADDVESLLAQVDGRVREGYRRIKLKIAPGWDIERVAAVRARFGESVPLSVDANGAYTLEDAERLSHLDEYALTMIEEPLAGASLVAHAELARVIRTPICLDESIASAHLAADAIVLGACSIINVKPARVGGLLEARRVHEVCRRRGVPVWCGGMFETGIGRAANLALAALPGFTQPSDISPAGRYYDVEITTPTAEMRDGCIAVPRGPGLGVTVERDTVERMATSVEVIRR